MLYLLLGLEVSKLLGSIQHIFLFTVIFPDNILSRFIIFWGVPFFGVQNISIWLLFKSGIFSFPGGLCLVVRIWLAYGLDICLGRVGFCWLSV